MKAKDKDKLGITRATMIFILKHLIFSFCFSFIFLVVFEYGGGNSRKIVDDASDIISPILKQIILEFSYFKEIFTSKIQVQKYVLSKSWGKFGIFLKSIEN